MVTSLMGNVNGLHDPDGHMINGNRSLMGNVNGLHDPDGHMVNGNRMSSSWIARLSLILDRMVASLLQVGVGKSH